MEEINSALSQAGTFIYRNLPSATSITGMFFYSFITYLVLFCLRKLRNEAIYPHMERNISEAVTKRRQEIREERGKEAQRMADKLQ
jgi:hypothetical protein